MMDAEQRRLRSPHLYLFGNLWTAILLYAAVSALLR
jgi:hypothetical protein